ncbi:MAG TPA: sigma 54-interacting transcriptional regulator, partial [bacterium]|nr:sigma 54-interacting transcriptional regulator [bacterium]
NAAVIRAIAINAAAMLATLAIGILSAMLVHRRLAAPMCELSEAVDKLREGENPPLPKTDAEVAGVAESIARLGAELAEKERLVDLKASDASAPRDEWDPEITRELSARIEAIEKGSPTFRKLRGTEAMGNSPAWLRTLRDAAIRARDRDPVVVFGPTGSGKTGVARVIHALGPRADRPLGEFNCAEFVSGDPLVVLGRLFGYGSDCGITGIERRGQKGILEEYDGGTLFFDEVALLSPHAQQLLLLPLEGRPFNPAAGKGPPLAVNVRFIFASNERLEDLVHCGRMRADFLRRIKARGAVLVPPLARRPQDIELLANHFLQRRNDTAERKLLFTNKTLELLSMHGYDHYNVSELSGVVDQAFDNALFGGSSEIEPRHLGADFLTSVGGLPAADEEKPKPFDSEEEEELAALRRFGFSIAQAEKSLGYAGGAKTLTNRLRGMAYRALDQSGCNVSGAVSLLAGQSADSGSLDRLESKMQDYLATARRHIENGTTDKLFNNLPQKYHPFVGKLLGALRGKLL